MPKLRAMVTLAKDSNLPADSIVNTWHFDTDTADTPTEGHPTIVAEAEEVIDRLQDFYIAIGPYLGTLITGAVNIKVYNLSDPKPRPPVAEADSVTTPTTASLPSEIALCLSFAADSEAGAVRARRRGRVYIGPMATSSSSGDSAGEVRPSVAQLNGIRDAAAALLARNGGGITWAVYSPTTDATGSLDDAFNDVTHGWVDNSYDVQRRRGQKSTLRTQFPV